MHPRNPLLLLVLFLFATTAIAQQPGASDTVRAAADRAFSTRDYATAAARYAELATPTADVVLCHHLGYCLHALGRLDEAMVWHQRAAGQHAQDARLAANATYNIACVHALQGHKEPALAALRLAMERGFDNFSHIRRDEDLTSLRQEPEFERLLASLKVESKLVVVVVHDGVEMLDFAGPVEVFTSARKNGQPMFEVKLVAPGKAPVRPQNMTAAITPDFSIENCPQPQVLVIPGGDTARLEDDPAFLAWVEKVAPGCEVVLSVCTGAFVLAKVGLLDGKAATTFHGAIQGLQDRYPAVRVQKGVKWVDSGRCVTAAGVSSGIDGALHVVARLGGEAAAKSVAEYIEFAWTPAVPAPVPSAK